jgi:tetratricopeptide (TPR) repeat protein
VGNKKDNKTETAGLRSEEEVASTSKVLEARKLLLNGEREMAYMSLKAALKDNPNNDAAYYEISRIVLYSNTAKAQEKALEYAKKASDLDPDNAWYHKNIIGIYKLQKDYEKAAKEARILVEKDPTNRDNYLLLANMYIHAEDYKSALNVYNDMEQQFGFDSGITLQRKQIYLKLGKYKMALKEVDQLIQNEPNKKEYYGMAADIYMANGDYDKAYEYIQKILEIDPHDGRVHLVLADYYRIKGNPQRSFQEVKKALGTSNLEIDTKIEVLIKYIMASATDSIRKLQANELMDTVLIANPTEPKALALKADLLNEEGNYKEAIIYFHKVIEIDSSRYLVWEQMLLVEERLQNYSDMANESARALRLFPQQPALYLFSGKANIKLENYSQAEEHLKMGLNFVFRENAKSDFYGLLAEAEFRQHKFQDAESHFKRAIEGNPNNAQALKDYAYYLTYYSKDAKKALPIARKAFNLKPDDENYYYVYAYILFKSGDKEQSLKWIKEGLEHFPKSKQLQMLDMEVNKNE